MILLRAILPCALAALLVSTGNAAAVDADALFFGAAEPGFPQPCSGCHGIDANGNREGARWIPPITWISLSRPNEGRAGYDAAALARLLRDGKGSDGQLISALMPRYDLSPQEVSELVQLLAVIGDRDHQGVYADRIDFGMILPPVERARPHHQRAASIVRRLFDQANAEGGVFGRRLALVTFAGRYDFESRAARQPVLATLLTLDRAGGAGIQRKLLSGGTPELFPVASVGAQDDARRVRGLVAGDNDIIRSLVDRLAAEERGDVLVIAEEWQLSNAVRRAAEIAIRAHGREAVNAPDRSAGSERPRAALLLGVPDLQGCLDGVRTVAGTIDTFAGLGSELAKECNWNLVLADPRFEPDAGHPNAQFLQQLAGEKTLLDTDRAAFVAAQLMLKAVVAAGRSVNRRTVVEALDRIGPQEFGIWPTLDYSKNRLNGTREVLIETAAAAATGR